MNEMDEVAALQASGEVDGELDTLREMVVERLRVKWDWCATTPEGLRNAADEAIDAVKPALDVLAWLHAEAVWLKSRERFMAETYSRLHKAVVEERTWLWTLASQLEADRDDLRAQIAAQNPEACFAVGYWGSRNTRYTCCLPNDGHEQHECGDVIWFGDHTPPCSCGRCPLTPSPEASSEASQEEARP